MVYNSTNSYLYQLWNNSNEAQIVELIQSGVSLIITICIFIRVFDLKGFLSGVKTRRKEAQKQKEKKEMEKLKKLMLAMKNNEDLSNISLSTDEEKEDEENGVLKIARKKKKKSSCNGKQSIKDKYKEEENNLNVIALLQAI